MRFVERLYDWGIRSTDEKDALNTREQVRCGCLAVVLCWTHLVSRTMCSHAMLLAIAVATSVAVVHAAYLRG